MADTYRVRDARRASGPYSPQDPRGADRFRGRGWDNDDRGRNRSRDRSWDRSRDMRRDWDRSLSRERASPRDRDLDWNRRPAPKSKLPLRPDSGARNSAASTISQSTQPAQSSAPTAPCESPLNTRLTESCSSLANLRFNREASTMSFKTSHPTPEKLSELVELFCDQVRSKTKLADVEQILNGRRSDLSRQQEKTPDQPSSWQAIQRSVTSGERDLSRSSRDHQQQSERLHSALGQFAGPLRDYVRNIVRDVLSEQKAGSTSPNAPQGAPRGPRAEEKSAGSKSIESRLAELERKHQSEADKNAELEKKRQFTADKNAVELRAAQEALKAMTAELKELQHQSQAMAEREKVADDLIEDHRNLVSEHQGLNHRCSKLESENQRFDRLLETSRKACENLDSKVEKPRPETKKLREDLEKTRTELADTKKELSDAKKELAESQDRNQKASSSLRGNLKSLGDRHDKTVARLSSVEKRATTIEGSLGKAVENVKGPNTSAGLGSQNNTPASERAMADITEQVRHATAEATAQLAADLRSMNETVQSHQALLNEFEPGELDKLWWTLPEVKQKNDALGEQVSILKQQVSALEKHQNDPGKEVREAKQGVSTGVSGDAVTSAASRKSTPSSGVEGSRPVSESEIVRTVNDAVKHVQSLKKAQDSIIQWMGRSLDEDRSKREADKKATDVEITSIKCRLDLLEKSKGTNDDTDTSNAAVVKITDRVSTIESDQGEIKYSLRSLTVQFNNLNNFVRDKYPVLSDRLDGMQELFAALDAARQSASMPSPSANALPNLRPPPRPVVAAQPSEPQDVKRRINGANGSANKRRRTEGGNGSASPGVNRAGGH